MPEPRWTVDDDGWLCRGPVAVLQLGKGDQRGVCDALNDGVRAARLADDMAAVIRRLDDGWRVVYRYDGTIAWRHIDGAHDDEPMSPGEVAALHHARQQEET